MDLPVDLRQNIEALEKTIQSHADASRPFSNRVDPTQQLCEIEGKLCLLEEKISAYNCLHAQQNSRISSLKKATSGHWKYSENTARTIEASRNDSSNSGSGAKVVTWSRAFAPNDPTSSHYEDILLEMEAQMTEAECMAEALKRQIEPFLNAAASSQAISSPAESVKFLLKTEQEISMSLQRRYNQIRDEIDSMRRAYRNFCSKYRRDNRDPFASKVIIERERERENSNSNKDFFGVNRPIPVVVQGTTLSLPSSTTGLPAKSSLGGDAFSFGRT